jgi:hypothetical protein
MCSLTLYSCPWIRIRDPDFEFRSKKSLNPDPIWTRNRIHIPDILYRDCILSAVSPKSDDRSDIDMMIITGTGIKICTGTRTRIRHLLNYTTYNIAIISPLSRLFNSLAQISSIGCSIRHLNCQFFHFVSHPYRMNLMDYAWIVFIYKSLLSDNLRESDMKC